MLGHDAAVILQTLNLYFWFTEIAKIDNSK